jgi:drug/metabolite transporter (DMT)-like permease
MRDLPAATTTSLGIVEPMAATLFSVTLLGEKLDVAAVIGTVLILVALIPLSASDD